MIQQRLADENPDVTDFRGSLAHSHSSIGWLHSQTGQTAEALDSHHPRW